MAICNLYRRENILQTVLYGHGYYYRNHQQEVAYRLRNVVW